MYGVPLAAGNLPGPWCAASLPVQQQLGYICDSLFDQGTCMHGIQHLRGCCASVMATTCWWLLLLLLRLLQVPGHIQRPDYAVTSVPTSELESKQQRAGVPANAALP
jgi:hypothetical protein